MVRGVNVRAIVIQGLLILTLCAFIELGAGFALKSMEKYLTLLPGLIVMVPPLLSLRGTINGALASRLGTALHTGIIKPRLALTAELKANIAASLILSFLASATIGLFSYAACILVGAEPIGVLSLVAIAVIAGFTSGLILATLTVSVAVVSFKKGLDPDNITSPTMATLGDFVTVACIFLSVILVG
jgi:mgtE-like transporter